jgi:hypothetical protein
VHALPALQGHLSAVFLMQPQPTAHARAHCATFARASPTISVLPSFQC